MASIFDRDEFKGLRGRWMSRYLELVRREKYYDGSIYDRVNWLTGGLPIRLTRGIRALYLPLARAVNVDAGIVPGGWTLAKSDCSASATSGKREAEVQAAVNQVLAWSRWTTDGVLYVHYGALYGSSALRVCDLRERGEVWIKPISPATCLLVEAGPYDRTPALALVVEQRTDDGGRMMNDGGGPSAISHSPTYEYAEVITPDAIRTFADGEPTSFGGRPAEYANALGFVPFVETPHINTGGPLGDCCFSRAMPLLDAVNETATDLAEIIKKHKDPQWGVIGAEPSELERGGDNIWFVPAGGNFKVLVPEINIDGTLSFIRELRNQVEKAMPELAFDELTSKDFVATPTVELQLLELIFLIQRVRPNYDAGLVEALRMAARAADSMLTASAGRSENADALRRVTGLDTDALAFDNERPVLPTRTDERGRRTEDGRRRTVA